MVKTPAKAVNATGRAVKAPVPAAAKRPSTKATTKAPTTKAPTTKAPTTKAPTTKAPGTKAVNTKAVPTKAVPTKAVPTKAVPTKAVPTKAVRTKAAAAKGTATAPAKVRQVPAKAVPVKAVPVKAVPVKAAAPKAAPVKAAKEAPAPKPVKAPAPRKLSAATLRFFEKQREKLLEERATYTHQAETLRLEAEQLAEEMEPGDIQFDEESGEGATMNVERERDLTLSAQASAAVDEIDRALAKIDAGTYGLCEQCGQPIVRARLEALPYASLCVACKSGGLSRR